MPNGLAGTTLRINLSTGEIRRFPTDEALYRCWHGGRGITAKIIYEFTMRSPGMRTLSGRRTFSSSTPGS